MSAYVIIWEFLVKPERESEFVRRYGPAGDWVTLFRQAPGYVETLLLKGHGAGLRYLTIDRWNSRNAYVEFRNQHEGVYALLDSRCEDLTDDERHIGNFNEV